VVPSMTERKIVSTMSVQSPRGPNLTPWQERSGVRIGGPMQPSARSATRICESRDLSTRKGHESTPWGNLWLTANCCSRDSSSRTTRRCGRGIDVLRIELRASARSIVIGDTGSGEPTAQTRGSKISVVVRDMRAGERVEREVGDVRWCGNDHDRGAAADGEPR
jgi:hypothetical protein